MSLHIIVCVKSVVTGAGGGMARRTPENSTLNPFDRPALEAALRLKTRHGASVTALSMGPDAASAALSETRAMGADRAVLINDRALAESDTLVTARVLAGAVRRLKPFDLLFFGTRTADSDTGQVGPQTATAMALPFVSGVSHMVLSQDRWQVQRVMDDWQEHWTLTPPAAVTIDARAFDPRPLHLAAIGQVYAQRSVETWKLADVGLAENAVGLAGSPTRVAALKTIKRTRACEFLDGEPKEQLRSLVERLADKGMLTS